MANKRTLNILRSKYEDTKVSVHSETEVNSLKIVSDKEVLERFRLAYENLEPMRRRVRRCINYTFGRQWSDLIDDPDSNYKNDKITEEDYIKREGKVPLKYNIIRSTEKSILGVYRSNKSEPLVVSRQRDKQKLGEMMTAMMQYSYQVNNISELNTRLLEMAFCSGFFIRSTYYRWNSERRISDVFVQNENIFKVAFNSNIEDPLFRDLTMIGVIRDMPLKELESAFCKSKEDVKALREEYDVAPHYVVSSDTYAFTEQKRQTNFYTPSDPSLCRVYEIWTKETEECWYCHDYATGKEYIEDFSNLKSIEEENEKRKREMQRLGFEATKEDLIYYEYKLRDFWYVRYMTPNGNVIFQGETPFEHGSHPITISAFPMINGEVFPPAEESIDIQRIINRTFTQLDFMRQNGAKNLLAVPVDAIPDGMSPKTFAREYTRNGGIMFYKPNKMGTTPMQIKTQSVQAGDLDVIRLFLQLNEQISGVSGSLKGEQALSGTPASLYSQQAQNSANNLTDFLEWFSTNVREFDTKLMQVIAQYKDESQYIPIAGKHISEEAKWYDPYKIRNCKFDVVNTQGFVSPAFRLEMERTLMQALQTQAIDFETFLESSSSPYADTLLEIMKKKREEGQLNSLQGMQDMNQQMQAVIPPQGGQNG